MSLRCVLRVQGCHHPSYIMVWWEVTHLHFCKKGVKLVSRVYQEDKLQGVVKHLHVTLFSDQEWVFQQDSVPTQKPRQLRSGCGGTFWPLSAPGIGPRGVHTPTPRDYKLWAVLEDMACQSITTEWRDPLWKQRRRAPWRQCVPR
jgi:hypothetical protein